MSDDEYPPGTLAAEAEKLAIEAENLKRLLLAQLVKTLGPLIDYMAKVGRRPVWAIEASSVHSFLVWCSQKKHAQLAYDIRDYSEDWTSIDPEHQRDVEQLDLWLTEYLTTEDHPEEGA